jgi:hypothetical protein
LTIYLNAWRPGFFQFHALGEGKNSSEFFPGNRFLEYGKKFGFVAVGDAFYKWCCSEQCSQLVPIDLENPVIQSSLSLHASAASRFESGCFSRCDLIDYHASRQVPRLENVFHATIALGSGVGARCFASRQLALDRRPSDLRFPADRLILSSLHFSCGRRAMVVGYDLLLA